MVKHPPYHPMIMRQNTPLKRYFLLLCIAIYPGAVGAAAEGGNPAAVFVCPAGDDGNDGSEGSPFATLERARDAVRDWPAERKAAGVTVWLKEGTHVRDRSFELDGRDSGTEDGPVVYRAVEGANVSLIGGVAMDAAAFEPVTDEAILARLDESARGKVLQYQIPEAHRPAVPTGVPVVNEWIDGVMHSNRKPTPELFFNEEALPFSRWPNDGWATYGAVIEPGSRPRSGEKPDRPGTLAYTGGRPERWTEADRILLHGYFAHEWFDDILVVDRLDTEQKHITFTTPHMYALRPNGRYRALGLLEEIDQPGEWMIDYPTGTLYLYPPADMAEGRFRFSVLGEPLVRLNGTRHVKISGLTLEVSAGMAVEIVGGTDNRIEDSTIRNVGLNGVLIRPEGDTVPDPGALHQFPEATGDPVKDGRRNGVFGCTLHDVGTTGIAMIGGDRRTLTPSEHYAVNNRIHNTARLQRANQPAINISGVGMRAAHNFIHDLPHVGISFSGNDHVMEYNELARVAMETGDVGVFYMGRDWTYRGNIVRYNFIHHAGGMGQHGSFGVYLDDAVSSAHIHGNVFYKVQTAVFVGGGRNNIVENNIIADSKMAMRFDNRGQTWAGRMQRRGGTHRMYERLAAVNHTQPPFSTRWPELSRILDEHPHRPLGNHLRHNIVVRTGWTTGQARHFLEVGENIRTQEDPGFVDAANHDFRLKDLEAIQEKLPRFQPIPFEKIGLQKE